MMMMTMIMREERNQQLARSTSKRRRRPVILCLWLAALFQILYTNSNYYAKQHQVSRSFASTGGTCPGGSGELHCPLEEVSCSETRQAPLGGLVMFAEAGKKKKKKEKSEVVVISVQNSPSKGHGYPIYMPACGGGYGRRKRRSITTYV